MQNRIGVVGVLLIFAAGSTVVLPRCGSHEQKAEKTEHKKADKNRNSSSESGRAFVYKVSIEGAITPAAMEQLKSAVILAEEKNARALLVLLNTPGGLMHSMDSMCRRILNAKIPIITYVYPPGSYSGSAGVYIMYSSHLAAMAPATNLGSATPVQMGGGKKNKPGNDRIPDKAGSDDTLNLKRKLFNHAKAQIRSYAEYHGRNSRFAERTITHAANVTSREALRLRSIELIANSPRDLLKKAHGRNVRMIDGMRRLDLKDVRIVPIKTDFRSHFLSFITNPVVVNLLMMIGVLGIMAEIQYPGAIFPGAIGAICLILGLYAMQSLSVSYAGLGLIVLGVIFFILEIKVVSYGLLSVAGIVCMIMGSIMLARSGEELVWSALAMILTTTAVISGIMLLLVYKAAQVLRRKPRSGVEALIREKALTETLITGDSGRVFLNSEIWSARRDANAEDIATGTRVRILRREGMTFYVEPDL